MHKFLISVENFTEISEFQIKKKFTEENEKKAAERKEEINVLEVCKTFFFRIDNK